MLVFHLIDAEYLYAFFLKEKISFFYRNFKDSTCTVISSSITTYHNCDHINPSDTHLLIYSSGHSCLKVLGEYALSGNTVE